MTTEQQLNRLRDEITYHRKKAESLRKRAEAQDRIADGKVRECAGLQTMELPIQAAPATDLFPARTRMRKAIAECNERDYEKAKADLAKEHHPM